MDFSAAAAGGARRQANVASAMAAAQAASTRVGAMPLSATSTAQVQAQQARQAEEQRQAAEQKRQQQQQQQQSYRGGRRGGDWDRDRRGGGGRGGGGRDGRDRFNNRDGNRFGNRRSGGNDRGGGFRGGRDRRDRDRDGPAAVERRKAVGGEAVKKRMLMSPSEVEVRVQPLAVLSVLNHFIRGKAEDGVRVIGALTGIVQLKAEGGPVSEGADAGKANAASAAVVAAANSSGSMVDQRIVVEVQDAFAVTHAERTDQTFVAMDHQYCSRMLQMRRRVHKNEVIVGWFSTAVPRSSEADPEAQARAEAVLRENAELVQDFFCTQCDAVPVHLVVDTAGGIAEKMFAAFIHENVTLGTETVGRMVHEVPCTLHSTDAAKLCLFQMTEGQTARADALEQTDAPQQGKFTTPTTQAAVTTEAENLHVAFQQLRTLLDQAISYTDAVISGEEENPRGEVGAVLAQALSGLPANAARNSDELLQALRNSSNDLTLLAYLSDLTRTQVHISAKLNAIV